jgi:hypothetical protein
VPDAARSLSQGMPLHASMLISIAVKDNNGRQGLGQEKKTNPCDNLSRNVMTWEKLFLPAPLLHSTSLCLAQVFG